MNPYHIYYIPRENITLDGIPYEQYYLEHQDEYVNHVSGYDKKLKSFDISGEIIMPSMPLFSFNINKLIEDNGFRATWSGGTGFSVVSVEK